MFRFLHWPTDSAVDVAVHIFNRFLLQLVCGSGEGYLVQDFIKFKLVGCYNSPNLDWLVYAARVNLIMDTILPVVQHTILLDDMNSKVIMWGPSTDQEVTCGRLFFWQRPCRFSTRGPPSFVRVRFCSHINVSDVSQDLLGRVVS